MSSSIADVAAHLFASENALLDPAVRRDRRKVLALLAEEFVEFGSSGRVWSRNEIVDHMESEDFSPVAIEDFACREIAADVMLVTYRSVGTNQEPGEPSIALRSSIWVRKSEGWLLRFHQGTRALSGKAFNTRAV
jgi:hypothetical protein